MGRTNGFCHFFDLEACIPIDLVNSQDEVSEISPAVQVKLLRTIQEKEVRPVGSSRSYRVDVRVFAATNRDLREAVKHGSFREDLFYRLNVLTVNVPPLRDRKEDIPLLVKYFLNRFSTDHSAVRDTSPEALYCLENYDWPGNVRELENVIRRAVALRKEDFILPEDLPPNLQIPPTENAQHMIRPVDATLTAYEKAAIQNALARSGNNRKKSAQILGIGEATLYRKLKKYGIHD